MVSSKEEDGSSSFTAYLNLLLRTSSLRGVLPHIDRSKSLQVWSLVALLLMVLGGFLYQAGHFLQLYLQYPSVTDMQITYPDQVPFPAIYVCNHNAFRRTKVCELEEDICFLSSRGEQICEEDAELCRNRTFMSRYMVPRLDRLDFEMPKNLKMVETYGHTSDMLGECRATWAPGYDFCAKDRLEHQVIQDVFELRRNCYIINSLVRRTPTVISNMPTVSSSDRPHSLSFVVDLEPFEYFQPLRPIQAYVQLLSPFSTTNPYREGMSLAPGKQYRIKFKPKVTTLLKAPYGANCTDYHGQRRSFDDPITQENCANRCIFRRSLETCSCMPIQVTRPMEPDFNRTIGFCPLLSLDSNHCTVKLNISECFSSCSKECNYITYDYRMVEEEYDNPPPLTRPDDPLFNATSLGISEDEKEGVLLPNIDKAKSIFSNWFSDKQFMKIIVEMEKPELLVYTQKPKYESIELFGYVGGYIGMWLGICLVMLGDILEILAFLLVYPFLKRH